MKGSSSELSVSEHKTGYVALVGPTNAGKSTLLNAIVGTKVSIVSAKAQTTRNRILAAHNTDNSQIIFVDTPGFFRPVKKDLLEKFLLKAVKDGLQDVDAVVCVCDVTKLVGGKSKVDNFFENMGKFDIGVPAIIVLNKIDKINKPDLLPILAALSEKFAGEKVEFIPISAAKNEGLKYLVDAINKIIPVGEPLYPKDSAIIEDEKFFVSELVREKVIRLTNQELPYSTAVRIEKWEDRDSLLVIHAAIIVERPSQKGIVIGSGGSKLQLIGTQTRVELENIFGCKVYLELFVRVEENWTSKDAAFSRVSVAS